MSEPGDQPKIPFVAIRRTTVNGHPHYRVTPGKRSEEEMLAELARKYGDNIDWEEYQRLSLELKAEHPEWQAFRIHRWLGSRQRLWLKDYTMPDALSEKELEAADRAYASLPDDADAAKAINWAITHPRVFRAGQMPPDEQPNTVISAADILEPCHGKAPSKLAVSYLRKALGNYEKFTDTVLSEQKKTTSKGGPAESDYDEWDDTDDDAELTDDDLLG